MRHKLIIMLYLSLGLSITVLGIAYFDTDWLRNKSEEFINSSLYAFGLMLIGIGITLIRACVLEILEFLE